MDFDDYNVPPPTNSSTASKEALIAELATTALTAGLKRPRKTRPKLNSALLLSDRGFKYLRQNLPAIAPFEEDDITTDGMLERLDGLLLAYREWAHYLFPSLQFDDFVARVEKECRTRPMKIYLQKLQGASAFDKAEFMADLVASEAAAASAKAAKERQSDPSEEEQEMAANSEDERFIDHHSDQDFDEDDDAINKILKDY